MFIPQARFYLKNINTKEPTLISLQIKFNGHRVFMSTGEKIVPAKWNFEKQRGIGNENADLNYWLNKIDSEVASIFRNLNIDGVTPTGELVLNLLKEKLDNTPITSKPIEKPKTLFDFISEYIEQSKAIKKHETIKAYKTTLNHLTSYSILYNKAIDFADINMDFYHSFTHYLSTDLGNSKNTVAKQIKTIKTFMNEATDRGLNTNLTFRNKSFKKSTEIVDKIYLTKEEIDILYSFDLSSTKAQERVRDLFIVSCYTGLRFSDFTEIKKENIVGNQIRIRTKKTDHYVVIPIASRVQSILDKYNYCLPTSISNAKMNKHLKDIGAKAGIDDPVVITKTEGGRRVQRTYRKWELMTAHCGRRSFATNAYKDNVPTISIMKLTGHTSEKAFLGYIRISQEENAELLQEHNFFK